MADSNSTLVIPKDVLEPIIQAHVNTAIAEALGGRTALIEGAVSAALNMKVGTDGKPSTYHQDRDRTFLQWIVQDAIRTAATQAVHEAVKGNLETVKAEVAKQLKRQNSATVRALIEGIAKTATDASKLRVDVKVEGLVPREY